MELTIAALVAAHRSGARNPEDTIAQAFARLREHGDPALFIALREEEEAQKIMADARAVADAGAFCIVVEGVLEHIASDVTRNVTPPVIGIGASAECDGQVLVTEDMLGLFERTPRFVKRYDDLAARIGEAARTYADEVRSRSFPTADQTYRPK